MPKVPLVADDKKLEAFALRNEGLSMRAIGERLATNASSVSRWLRDPALQNAWKLQFEAEQRLVGKAPARAPASTTGGSPATESIDFTGEPLGLTEETMVAVADALCAGVSLRMAAWAAGLSEFDLRGWYEEAAGGREPFASALRAIHRRVAAEVMKVAIMVKGGGSGYQARIRWLGSADPDAWSDRERQVESEQDRAAGLTDEALQDLIATHIQSQAELDQLEAKREGEG